MQAKRICFFGGEVKDKKTALERIETLLKSLSESSAVELLFEGRTPFVNLCRKAAEKLHLRKIEYQKEGDFLYRLKKNGEKREKSIRIEGKNGQDKLFVEFADICIFYCLGEYISLDRINTGENRTQLALRYAYFLKGLGKDLTIFNIAKKEKPC